MRMINRQESRLYAESNHKRPQFFPIQTKKIKATISNIGARLVAVQVPNKLGDMTDVLLGLSSAEQYLSDPYCLGAIIGRNANRIAGSRFLIADKEYFLKPNDGRNNLHSGPNGFEHRIWTVKGKGDNYIRLALNSPDGDQGFPGTFNITATYQVFDQELSLSIIGSSNQTTIANMTSHAYWNLGGTNQTNCLGDQLMIDTDQYCPTDSSFIPLHHINVMQGPMDFRHPRLIKDGLHAGMDTGNRELNPSKGYNHAFVFEDAKDTIPERAQISKDGLRTMVKAYNADSGIHMILRSSAPSVLFYSAGFMGLDKQAGSGEFGQYAGYALEPGFVPNAVNDPSELSPILPAGKPYLLNIQWIFDVDRK